MRVPAMRTSRTNNSALGAIISPTPRSSRTLCRSATVANLPLTCPRPSDAAPEPHPSSNTGPLNINRAPPHFLKHRLPPPMALLPPLDLLPVSAPGSFWRSMTPTSTPCLAACTASCPPRPICADHARCVALPRMFGRGRPPTPQRPQPCRSVQPAPPRPKAQALTPTCNPERNRFSNLAPCFAERQPGYSASDRAWVRPQVKLGPNESCGTNCERNSKPNVAPTLPPPSLGHSRPRWR